MALLRQAAAAAALIVLGLAGSSAPVSARSTVTMGAALARAESAAGRDPRVLSIATAYDGKDLIKFRMLVERGITRSQAKALVDLVFSDIAGSLREPRMEPADLLRPYAVAFQIAEANDLIDPLFQGRKDRDATSITWSAAR